jgi:hypothetical protein
MIFSENRRPLFRIMLQDGVEDMALFGFRIRNPARDRQTDENRLERLRRMLRAFQADIEHERDGLRTRYEGIMADAAFSQQALEDDRADPTISSRIDDMTDTMIRYDKRLARLESQIAFVTGLDREAVRFFEENEDDGGIAGTARGAPS